MTDPKEVDRYRLEQVEKQVKELEEWRDEQIEKERRILIAALSSLLAGFFTAITYIVNHLPIINWK